MSDTFDQLWKDACDSAIWVTASPHEWVWTHEQQVVMARFCCEASKRLSLWQWLTENCCTVQEAAVAPGEPRRWFVADVDNDVLGSGPSPEAAILAASGMDMSLLSEIHPTPAPGKE